MEISFKHSRKFGYRHVYETGDGHTPFGKKKLKKIRWCFNCSNRDSFIIKDIKQKVITIPGGSIDIKKDGSHAKIKTGLTKKGASTYKVSVERIDLECSKCETLNIITPYIEREGRKQVKDKLLEKDGDHKYSMEEVARSLESDEGYYIRHNLDSDIKKKLNFQRQVWERMGCFLRLIFICFVAMFFLMLVVVVGEILSGSNFS